MSLNLGRKKNDTLIIAKSNNNQVSSAVVTHRPKKHCHSGLFCEASSESLAPNNLASKRTTARRSSPSLLWRKKTNTHLIMLINKLKTSYEVTSGLSDSLHRQVTTNNQPVVPLNGIFFVQNKNEFHFDFSTEFTVS